MGKLEKVSSSYSKAQAEKDYFSWAIKHLRNNGDDEDLHAFIELFFGFRIPTKSVCPHHDSPFQFVADTFFERINECIVMANRNGGKTQNFGIKNGLDALFKGCEIATIGAIQPQAEKCYRYTQQLLNKKHISDHLVEALMKRTLVRTYDGHISEISILAGTMSGVNSPHPEKANLDEVELMDWNVLQEAMSMPKSTKRAKASLCITSTRKFSYGPMQRLLDEADEKGFKVYQWCIWEVIEKCPDSRSGTLVVPHTFLPYGERKPKTIKVFNKCLKCELVEVCQGKAKKSDGYYTIDDTIRKFKTLDRAKWDAQWECKKPGREGLVYDLFDENVHILDSWIFDPSLPTYAGQDFGYTNPSHTIFAQVTPSEDIVIFDEIVKKQTPTPHLVHIFFKPAHQKYKIQGWYSDPRGNDEIAQMKEAGLPAIAANSDVAAGIDTVRHFLMPPSKRAKLFIAKKCMYTIKDLNTYHYMPDSDSPKKDEGDHGCDAIRYFLHTKFPIIGKGKKISARSY